MTSSFYKISSMAFNFSVKKSKEMLPVNFNFYKMHFVIAFYNRNYYKMSFAVSAFKNYNLYVILIYNKILTINSL